MSAIDAPVSTMSQVAGEHPATLAMEMVDTAAALAMCRRDYETVAAACGNRSPFALLEWHVAWCSHFLNRDPTIEDRLMVYVLRDASICVGIVPLVASTRRVGPLSLTTLDLLGADPSTTESRTPLVMPGYESRVVQALRARLHKDPDWSWISWRNLTGPLTNVLAQAPRSVVQREPPGYELRLTATWEEFRNGLKRNIRESLRHCYNSLKRDGLSFKLEIAESPAEVRLATQHFLALHALRASMEAAVEHPNHFASEISRSFLYDVCDRLAVRGAMRIFQLSIDGRIVAVRIGFVIGTSLYLYYSGFDPQWARYSVMTTTIAEAVKYAISQGFTTVNLSRGTDVSKTRWGPEVIEYDAVLEVRDRWSARALHFLYRRATRGAGAQSWLLSRLKRARRTWQ